MNIFYSPEIVNGEFYLPQGEAIHCSRVMRKSIGDSLDVIDGQGGLYHCRIVDISKRDCLVEVLSKQEHFGAHPYNLHIAIAPTKNIDRVEWFLEKSTEIGINKVSFLRCKNSERVVIKSERFEKIVVSGIKQSLKAFKPQISELIDFNTFVKQSGDVAHKYIAYCSDEHPKLEIKNLNFADSAQEILILIGPEGDFSPEEVCEAIKYGFIPISLGQSRLRTETAALYSVAVISSKF